MTRPGVPDRDVNRENLVDWARAVIAEADSLAGKTCVERHVSPGGIAVAARFDDPVLAAAYCGRFHDAAPDAVEGIRVNVLTGRGMAQTGHWRDPAFEPREFHAALKADGLRAAYPFADGVWRLFDIRSRVGLQWCSTTGDLPPWDGSAPLRQHLHWTLEQAGMRLAHAATLGLKDRGIVLFGRGGAGKSGTTLAGLAAGLCTVGDDYIALANEPVPLARPLFRTVKQDREGLARVPGLASRTMRNDVNWRGKVEFDPTGIFAGALVDRLPIKAVVLPSIAHVAKPALIPTRPQAAMLALMTSNLHQFAGEPDGGMHFFAAFLKDLPCFRLDLSPDAVRNGNLLRDFVERLPGEEARPPA
jgi:hypothetical protein